MRKDRSNNNSEKDAVKIFVGNQRMLGKNYFH